MLADLLDPMLCPTRSILFLCLASLTPLAAQESVSYEDFGAKGDGKTDDIEAIIKAHDYANQHGLPVKAKDGATYYIGGLDRQVIIQTDTDFGSARFIIDDTNLENRMKHVFSVQSKLSAITPEGITSLKRGQAQVDAKFPQSCLVRVKDANTKRFIRRGLNQNSGSSQTDVFLVDENGKVDPKAPIIWDFEQITKIEAYPIDEQTLTISGGRFTTIANQGESKYHYHRRGLEINRSNVVVKDLEHRVTGEGDHGSPYYGFIYIKDSANVVVRDSTLSGRKAYKTIGSAGKPVTMGSYDLAIVGSINVSIINVNQFNDINDRTYWGIMTSNGSKNLIYDGCKLSRFDAHAGVANVTIRNSSLGYMGIKIIGNGTLLVENTTVYDTKFIELRRDYGSTWQGDFIIRNCTFKPGASSSVQPAIIGAFNDGQHDFGYTCYLPEQITIDGLRIDDAKHPENYQGPLLFSNYNSSFTTDAYVEKFPYQPTREVSLSRVTSASDLPLIICENPYLFRDLEVIDQKAATK